MSDLNSLPLAPSRLQQAIDALRCDLLSTDGPRISTMRNYRFAIVPYRPTEELRMRELVRGLAHEMKAGGWVVLTIELGKLLAARIRAQGDAWVASAVGREKRLFPRSRERALNVVKEKVTRLVEGPDGIAADIAEEIAAHVAAHPDRADRTVALIARGGALYPFGRMSALLKHLDGRTCNLPVVLLYPGTRSALGLSFMGVMPPDPDYRPRIYP